MSKLGDKCRKHASAREKCSVADCTSNAVGQTLCRKHGGFGICDEDGCQNFISARKKCKIHNAVKPRPIVGATCCVVGECMEKAKIEKFCEGHAKRTQCVNVDRMTGMLCSAMALPASSTCKEHRKKCEVGDCTKITFVSYTVCKGHTGLYKCSGPEASFGGVGGGGGAAASMPPPPIGMGLLGGPPPAVPVGVPGPPPPLPPKPASFTLPAHNASSCSRTAQAKRFGTCAGHTEKCIALDCIRKGMFKLKCKTHADSVECSKPGCERRAFDVGTTTELCALCAKEVLMQHVWINQNK